MGQKSKCMRNDMGWGWGNSRKQKAWPGQMAEEGQEQKGKPKQTTHAEWKTEEKRKDRVRTNQGHQQDGQRQKEEKKPGLGSRDQAPVL